MRTIVRNFLLACVTVISFSSCEELQMNSELTTEEIVEGLKTALTVGADTAATNLSVQDGYYGNSFVKIPLPEQVNTMMSNVEALNQYVPGLSTFFDDRIENLILAINRSAEDAAKEAGPIFVSAITNLSITDGLSILNGKVPSNTLKSTEFDSLAATQYLKNETFESLSDLYSPKLNSSLSKDFVLGYSAVEIWNELTGKYNQAAELANAVSFLTGKSYATVNTNLGQFVTEKALDGLFYKVGQEEKQIRNNPFEWGLQILEKVFGNVKTSNSINI